MGFPGPAEVMGRKSSGVVSRLSWPSQSQNIARSLGASLGVAAKIRLPRGPMVAEKDQLRAGFAVSTRRLEVAIERLTAKTGTQTVEIDRKREEIAKLAEERAARVVAIAGLEGRVAGLTEALSGTEEKLSASRAELAARDRELAERAQTLQAVRDYKP